MPRFQTVSVPLAGTVLADTARREPVDLGGLAGVHVMVLMRHRH